ncbi:LPXTG cell wall anchor domain-containing protein [Loigolactobacillus bifermentans]|nr:LPXTG cell wall anchor domain-containing protein [Loigolactobacillus bifermentans]
MMRQKSYRQASGETTTHYKLYKAKKNWLIAGISLFSFGVGTVGMAQATPVAAAATVTGSTAPASATLAVSSAASAAVVTAAASAATSSAATSATPTSQAVTTPTASKASSAASSAAVSSRSAAVSSATPVSAATPASSTASSAVSAAPVASSAAASSTATVQYQTPPVKDGGVQDEKVATVQPKSEADTTISTAGTTFIVNFNVKAGDTVTVKIDGADISDALFTNGPTQYAKVDNVVMAKDASNVNTLENQADGAIIDSIIKAGSYQQSFNLLALQNYTEYSTTATGYATETVTDRKIQVFINGDLADQTTFQATYNVVPVRLVRANYYQDFVSYNADQEVFQLPNFGISGAKNQQAGSLSLNDLAQLNATAAEYRVVMPDDFVLDQAATADLNANRPYTITQDATTHEIVLTYDLTAQAVADDATVYVQGAFTGYNPDKTRDTETAATPSEVIVATPNVIKVTQQDGTVLAMQSSGNNKFSYVSGDTFNTSYWTSWPNDYISNANNSTVYPDLQRAAASADAFNLSVGTAAYFGSAATNGNELITIPTGFTTTAMNIEVKQSLLDVNDNQPLPYQITYTDGTQTIGTLTGTTNKITLDAGKVVQTIAYQFNVPNTPRLTNGQSQAEEVTGAAAYDHVEPYVSLPVVHLTLNTDSTTEMGQYPVTSTLTFTNATNQQKTDHAADQYIQVVDGQTNAYVTVAANAQTQTNTSRGTVLTDSGTTYLSGVASKPTAGLTLSNGTTSKSTDLEAQFLNEPIFYFIAPAQTTFVVNQTNLTSKIPGAVLTEYTTPDGKDAYKIDLTNATSDEFVLSGDAWYRDDQPIAVTGVFRNGTIDGYRADNGILERLINMFEIKADDNALEGSDDLQIFYTSKNQINDLTAGQDTNGTLTGDPNAIKVTISNPTYKIQNLSGVNGYAEIQGSEDPDFSDTGRTSVYNMLDDNQFAVTVTNVADKALNNVNVLVNLPTKDDVYGSAFTVNLADNSDLKLPAGITVYYGTTAQAQQTGISEPTRAGYVTGDAVTDWSAIRSVIVHADSVASQAALAQVSFKIQDPTQLQDVGKTAYFDTGVYADDLIPIIANKTMAAKLTVQGTATVNYAFLLPDGSQVAAPQLTQTLQLGSDTITKPALTLADLPAGYDLVGADGKALSFTESTTDYQVGQTVNSDADYSSLNGVNGTAQIGTLAQYDADGDTILIPVMDPNAVTQAATINYVDQDANNAPLHTDTLTGLSGTTQDYSTKRTAVLADLATKGYVYVKQDGDALDDANVVDFDAADQVTTIYLKHATASTTERKTITETITYVYTDGSTAAPTVTDQVNFDRTNTTDQVTQQVTNGDWVAENGVTGFTEKVSPLIDNYSADQLSVPEVTHLTAASSDVTVMVTYTLDDDQPGLPSTGGETTQKATIDYVDQDANNQVLHTDDFTGESETTIDYSTKRTATLADLTAKGYVYVKQAGDALNAANQVAFDADDGQNQVTTIYLKHNTTVVTPDMPTPPTETPTGTSTNDLNRTVTQTVQYVYSTGGKVAADQTQQVTFQRAAVVDQVTGQVLGYLAPSDVAGYQTGDSNVTLTDNGWTVTAGSADFKAITSPKKAGYTNDLATTQAYTVTPTTGDALLTVTYTAVAPQRVLVNYVDDDANGAQVHQDILTGVPAETTAYAKVQNEVEQGLMALGYVIVGNDLPTQSIITFDDQAGDQIYTVHLKHQIQPATANLQKVVTETVTYVYANGTTAAPMVTDQVTFQRHGTVDQVTGQATYTAWTAQAGDTTFEAKVSPSITGYTPDQIEIAAVTGLTAASANVQATVTYTKATDGGTTTPGNPGTDGGATTPDNPGTDGGTTTPDNPGTDGGTTTPDNPGTNGGTTTPDNPGTDGGTTTPDNPGTDGGTTTPDNPGTDGGTTTPDNPGTDGGTTTPDNPGTDGGTTTTPVDPTISDTPAVSSPSDATTATAVTPKTPQQVTLTSQATTLPQTSDANETWLAAAGLTMLGSIGLLGATTLRKRRDNDAD